MCCFSRISRLLMAPFLVSVLVPMSQQAMAQVENFVGIDVPGAINTFANDINNLAIIVGRFDDADGAVHGFVLDQGVFTTVDFPGAAQTVLLGINDSGDMVGRYRLGDVDHGFLLSAGEFTTIDFPGATQTQCHGINLQGQIVGRQFSYKNDGQGGGTGRQHEFGWLLSDGAFTALDYPDSSTTDAWKISDSGAIVGDWSTKGALQSGSVHGYVLEDGAYTNIDVPGAVITATREVNSQGDMIGIFWDHKFLDHGFVRIAGSFVRFDYPGARETDGNAINDLGMIVGTYDTGGSKHGYVARLQQN